jgi:hypothetical protein
MKLCVTYSDLNFPLWDSDRRTWHLGPRASDEPPTQRKQDKVEREAAARQRTEKLLLL